MSGIEALHYLTSIEEVVSAGKDEAFKKWEGVHIFRGHPHKQNRENL